MVNERPLSSRVHPLNGFPELPGRCYVKRDDELGCGISGSKLRKYASLIPFFKEQGITHLVIIAGCQSNNLLAALQIARELSLGVTLFLLKPHHAAIAGNFKLSSLFINDSEIVWIPREDWPCVDDLAEQYCAQLPQLSFVLKEGASVPQALAGAMTIAQDICRNEQEHALCFQHIFVEAGTGFSATGLIHGLNQLQHPALVHVLLLADKQELFQEKMHQWLGYHPINYQCFYPQTARSFGAINQEIKLEIKRLAQEEGILADPIYAAKLFHESRRYLMQEQLNGPILIIHSGGTLTMAGFDL